MLQIELEPELEQKLSAYADHEKLPANFVLNEVLRRWLEDREDYAAGIRALAEMKYSISLDEMERLSNVAD